MDWRERVSFDQNICHGKPCITGTRVMVSVLIDNVADRVPRDVIMREYHVQEEDIDAALGYAADLARDPVISLLPSSRA
jgi:uncharacterized protein (DUF433 family)